MPLGEGGPHERGDERKAPIKKVLFYRYWPCNVKMVAERHRHAAYHKKQWRQSFLRMSTSMTLNDLEPPK